MFKKIEIWILYLSLILLTFAGLAFGTLVSQEERDETKKGNFDISFLSEPAAYIARIPEQLLRLILAPNPFKINDNVFYSERDFFQEKPGFSGATNLEETYLLLSRYNGELNEGVVELRDLQNFNLLHSWNPDINAFNDLVDKNDEFKNLERDSNNQRFILFHPQLTKDGGLIFGWEAPLRKIDACSNLVFQNTDDMQHHSIEVDIDGYIWVPSFIYPSNLSAQKIGTKFPLDGGYHDDGLTKLSNDGKVILKKSVSQILIDNGLEHLLFSYVGNNLDGYTFDSDPIHLNDIQPVNFDGNHWKKGDVFLSLRHLSMVLLYRPSENKIVWKREGPFTHQHDINIIDSHRISIFNNNSKMLVNGASVDGVNEVLIYDFETDEFSSYLPESLENYEVKTLTQGRSKILHNGDLFIEESNFGRLLYFNSDGSLRWSYLNKNDKGDIYTLGWSRILSSEQDINNVKFLLQNKKNCDA